jgi:hypothetical protein
MTDTPDDQWLDVNIPPIDQEPPRRNGYDNVRFWFTQFRDIELSTTPAYIVDQIIPRLGVVVGLGQAQMRQNLLDLRYRDARRSRVGMSRAPR